MKKVNLTILAVVLIFIKEIFDEVKYIKENPVLILMLLIITGILPAICCGILYKIFGL